MIAKLSAYFADASRTLSESPLVRQLATPRGLFVVFCLYYLIGTLGILARYEFNPSALVRFGHYYVEQNPERTPAGVIRFTGNEEFGGNGYDGQIFYYYGRTLFEPGVWPEGFSRAYRAPRAGYPVLVAPFIAFGDWGVIAGLYIVQLLCLLAALFSVYALLPADRKWAAIFCAFSPFAFMAYALMVSDSIMIGLACSGLFCLQRGSQRLSLQTNPDFRVADRSTSRALWLLAAWACFSLSILAKESAFFLLFPLGLFALWRRSFVGAGLMLAVLLPAILWQAYLRTAHGMVPAEVLSIFLAPLDGIFGVLRESVRLLVVFAQAPGGGTLVALIKHGAKLLLLLALLSSIALVFTGGWRKQTFVPLRLGVLLTALHIIIADWFYFWGIFDNVGRMFTFLVPLIVLLKGQDAKLRSGVFFLAIGLLSAFVLVRALLFTPQFPYDVYEPYAGPDYATVPVGPER